MMKSVFKFPNLYKIKKRLTRVIFFIPGKLLTKKDIDFNEFIYQQCREGYKILDIGCGDGFLYPILKNKFKNIEYTGIDSSPEMIEYCRKKYPEANWLVGNLDTLNFEKKYFDLGTFIGVIHHIENDRLVEKSIKNSVNFCKKVIIRESIQSQNFLTKKIKSFLWSIYDEGRRYYTKKELNDIYKECDIKKLNEFCSHPLEQHYLALIKKNNTP